jgi:2-iminobutanoate/2-iminopropanoate deaminase
MPGSISKAGTLLLGGVLFGGTLLGGCTARAGQVADGGSARAGGPARQVISPPGATRIASYASAVRSGNLIFFSGVIGTLPGSRELAAGGVQGELRQVFANLREIMAAAGAGPADMVKCTVFLADIADFDAMNVVYAEFFAGDPPARSTVGVAGLPLNARVELECIAAAPGR